MSNILNPICNMGIKIAMGSFYTCPINSTLAEANMIPLQYSRKLLICKHASKLSSTPENPNCQRIFTEENHLFESKINIPKTVSQRLLTILDEIDIQLPNIMLKTPLV